VIHFRGLLSAGVWHPLCSTKADPRQGPVTTTARDVECPTCRRMIGMTGKTRSWDERKPAAGTDEAIEETERRIR
jgi:hypothetical protein